MNLVKALKAKACIEVNSFILSMVGMLVPLKGGTVDG